MAKKLKIMARRTVIAKNKRHTAKFNAVITGKQHRNPR